MTIKEQLAAFGLRNESLVFVTDGAMDALDVFAEYLVSEAVKGTPIFAGALRKTTADLGRDLLHGLARIPSEQSTLTEDEGIRLAAAATAINELPIELFELTDPEVQLDRLVATHGDKRPVVAIDLRGVPQCRSPWKLSESVRHLLECGRAQNQPGGGN